MGEDGSSFLIEEVDMRTSTGRGICTKMRE